MDWSRQGLTKNESLRSLEGALQRGGSELAGPRWVLRLFLRDFCETGERAASGETAPEHRKRRFPEHPELEAISGSALNIFGGLRGVAIGGGASRDRGACQCAPSRVSSPCQSVRSRS
ncbi:Myotubularin-Related Protein 13 [Manis pentadactyla]|nr:Myotubularin-Related Protein 13 [Manis pentadactyla]